MAEAGKDIAKVISKGIDWEFIAKAVVSDEGRRELLARRRSLKMSPALSRTSATRLTEVLHGEAGPKIVDTSKLPLTLSKATDLEEESKREIVRLDGELEKIRREKELLRTRTVDDYLRENPKLKEEIDDEVRNQNWG
ncbi:unnamed protein product [Calypogeia fissa]